MRYALAALAALLILSVSPVADAAALQKTATAKDGAKMVLVPAGKFVMGSNDEDIAETSPYHNVYLDAFYMDVYEVTNKLFVDFLNDTRPGEEVGGKRWNWLVTRDDTELDERFTWWPTEIIYEDDKYLALEGYEQNPVITASWYAAKEYCKWAGKRLPTEAEWEKAARGGKKKKRFPWGDPIPTGGLVFDRPWRDNQEPAPTGKVGNYFPNDYGIYDMAGNVWEWAADWFDPNYYKRSDAKNPKGPSKGELKIVRGGGWNSIPMGLRVAIRNTDFPQSTNDGIGFRCAMDAGE